MSEPISIRARQAAHALVDAHKIMGAPVTAPEVLEYDSDSPSLASTRSALNRAAEHGLAVNINGYWSPTDKGRKLHAWGDYISITGGRA